MKVYPTFASVGNSWTNPCSKVIASLFRRWDGTSALKTCLQFLHPELPPDPAALPCKSWKPSFTQNMPVNIHKGIIHSNQKLEPTQMSIHRGGEWTADYTSAVDYHSAIKRNKAQIQAIKRTNTEHVLWKEPAQRPHPVDSVVGSVQTEQICKDRGSCLQVAAKQQELVVANDSSLRWQCSGKRSWWQLHKIVTMLKLNCQF